MTERGVYLFSEFKQAQKEHGIENFKTLLGNKGYNLAEISNIEGLPVPKGFTITTKACKNVLSTESDTLTLPDELWNEIVSAVQKLEEETEKKIGNSLILSCRPGFSVKVSNMIQTFFDAGLNDAAVLSLSENSEDLTFVHSIYHKYLQQYATSILKVGQDKFDELMQGFKMTNDVEELNKFETQLKEMIEQESGSPFPQDPLEQLKSIILYMFEQHKSDQFQYLQQNELPEDTGFAITIQVQVHGNMNESSGSGSIISRNPSDGDTSPTGDFLQQATGLDLSNKQAQPYSTLEHASPTAFEKFPEVIKKIETYFKAIQKIDFTVENNEIYILQTKPCKTSAHASFKILVDMVNESILSKEEAISKLSLVDAELCCHDPNEEKNEDEQNQPQYLNLEEETEFQQLLTWADELRLAENTRKGQTLQHGLNVRANANTTDEIAKAKNLGADAIGLIRTEKMFLTEERIPLIQKLIISDNEEEIQQATNDLVEAQTPEYVSIFEALQGMSAIIKLPDLLVTQFLPDIYDLITEIEQLRAKMEFGISVEEEEDKKEEKQDEENQEEETKPEEEKTPKEPKPKPIEIKQKLYEKVSKYVENNPKLGTRGVRLFLEFPNLFKAILKSIIEAAIQVQNTTPELLVPYVTSPEEFKGFKHLFDRCIQDYSKEKEAECPVQFKIGCEISIPNCALTAQKIKADFISFDQIGLTGSVYGYGYEESESTFMKSYKEQKVFPGVQSASPTKKDQTICESPFQCFDIDGVGKLVQIAVKKARDNDEEILTGVVTNDKDYEFQSVQFYHNAGLNYFSCLPNRLPIARIAAAKIVAAEKIQTQLENEAAAEKESEETVESSAPLKDDKDETATTETEETDED